MKTFIFICKSFSFTDIEFATKAA